MRLESFFTVGEQMQLFLISCLFGIPIGIFYDIFRVIRIILPHSSLLTAAEDVLFFVLYSVFIMSFTFSAARSEFRMYYIFGNIIGFAVYYFTIGRLVTGLFMRITLMIKRGIQKIRFRRQ
ncbi:MAG: hypothetical protein E7505_07885 [Ruminococcus sp.]|nr:hypothetical protein [Ruminococcus sp.]